MDKMTINVPDGHEIDLTKSNLSKGEIYFKKLESKYPLSVKEIPYRNWFIASGRINKLDGWSSDDEQLSTESRAKAFLALMQLVELRDAWNKIDGFEVDWNNDQQPKHTIFNIAGKISLDIRYTYGACLCFGSDKISNLFYNTFTSLIEEAKELL